MVNDWKYVKLSDIAFVTDFTANGSFASLRENVKYLNHEDYAILVRLIDFNRNWDGDFVYVPEHSFNFLKKCQLTVGDVIVANVGANAGTLFRVPDLHKPAVLGPNSLVIKTDGFINSSKDYLYYYFTSPKGQDQIQSIVSGSAQPKISKTDFRNLKIPLPPLPEQRAIADVLSALDDKIALNRRMNRTLELLAQAMFKHMLIDNLADYVFEEKPLDQIASFLNGLALQKFPPEGEDFLPVIKIAQLRTNKTENSDKASAKLDSAYVVNDGDVLFSWSGSLEVVLWCGGRGALNQHLFKVTSKYYPKWFYYYWIREHLPEFQAIAAGKATTMGHIQRHHLSQAKVYVPSVPKLNEMTEIMEPLVDKIIANNIESRTLTELRDTLLPKLMSGQVRVTPSVIASGDNREAIPNPKSGQSC